MELSNALGTLILFSTILGALSAFAERVTDIIKGDALVLGKGFFKKDLELLTKVTVATAMDSAACAQALEGEQKRAAKIQAMNLLVCLLIAHLLGVDATAVFKKTGFDLAFKPALANLWDGGIWITGFLMSRGSKYWHGVVNVINDLKTTEGDLRKKLSRQP